MSFERDSVPVRLAKAFTPRRMLADLLAWLGYRRFQAVYWKLRAADIVARYGSGYDFETLQEWITKTGPRRILELGCGNGRAFALYQSLGVEEVHAFEMAGSLFQAAEREAAQSWAAGRGTRFFLNRADIREPLPNLPPIDLLIVNRVLQHIDPRDIVAVLSNVRACSPRYIYINESLAGRTRLPHVFCHNYAALFREIGYAPFASGEIPGIHFEYLVFCRNS